MADPSGVYNNPPDLVPRQSGMIGKIEIVLEHDIDEQYHYRPGQTIDGQVNVQINGGNVNLINLKINILGLSSVGWQGKDGCNLSSQEEYINENVQLAPIGAPSLPLTPGLHEFTFNYQLPNRIPSSFIGKYGSITYVIKATAQDARQHLICSEPFLVANRQFGHSNQEMMQPIESRLEKKYKGGLFKKGKIKVYMKLPRRGYYPGDDINLHVEVINKSARTVTAIQASLFMHTSFTAQTNVHTHIQNLVKKVENWELVCGEGRRWSNASITIPQHTPESHLEGCDIIETKFEVTLKVEVRKKKKNDEDLLLSLPVLIGPLNHVIDPGYRPSAKKKPPKTIDRKTLEHMDMQKLLELQQEEGTKFHYDQPVNDGTLRVNPLYNKNFNTSKEEAENLSGSDESLNQSTRL